MSLRIGRRTPGPRVECPSAINGGRPRHPLSRGGRVVWIFVENVGRRYLRGISCGTFGGVLVRGRPSRPTRTN
eukprot:3380540-Karenia_brevis.AAC.1